MSTAQETFNCPPCFGNFSKEAQECLDTSCSFSVMCCDKTTGVVLTEPLPITEPLPVVEPVEQPSIADGVLAHFRKNTMSRALVEKLLSGEDVNKKEFEEELHKSYKFKTKYVVTGMAWWLGKKYDIKFEDNKGTIKRVK